MSICSGWFATPTTIATAGHRVDPELRARRSSGASAPDSGMDDGLLEQPLQDALLFRGEPGQR
jgi:hypothetical protein